MKKYVCVILLGGLFLLMLGLPSLASLWEETVLLSVPQSRPLMEGQLSAEVQEIPIVYGLYCKRILSGSEINGVFREVDPQDQISNLTRRLEELEEAGGLPPICMEEARNIFQLPNAISYIVEQDGFRSLIYQGYESGGQVRSVILDEHPKTGLITSCSISDVTSDGEATALLEAYCSYLGLNKLTDWQTRELEESAVSWSESGQIYLSCTFQNHRFYIGAVSIGAEGLKTIAEKFPNI